MNAAQTHRIGSLDLNQDTDFERRSWFVQRVAWVIMALVLVAALLGLFGKGWLSAAEASTSSGQLRVHYERFVRFQAPSEIELSLGRDAASDGVARVWISRAFFDAFDIRMITPAPLSAESGPDGFIYSFRIAETEHGEPPEESSDVLLQFDVQHIGPIEARIGLIELGQSAPEPSEIVVIKPFAYP